MNNPKTIVLLLVIATAFLPLRSLAGQGKPYQGEIRILTPELLPEGDSLRIRFVCDAQGVKVASRQSVELVPLLIGADTSCQMPVIAVKGRANYLVSRREQALAGAGERAVLAKNAPYAVIRGYGRQTPRQVEYSRTVAFEPWMSNAGLVVKEDLCGCGVTHTLSMSSTLARVETPAPAPSDRIIIPHPFVPHLTYIAPPAVSTRREISSEAALDFVVSKTEIRPDYMDNAAELKRVQMMIDSVRKDPRITVRSISVIGFASPEGVLFNNKRLSEGRALALVNYLSPNFDFPKEMYHVIFGGENWAGLRQAVAESDLPFKKEVLHIIDNVPVIPTKAGEISRKRAIYELDAGRVYRYLLSTYYPHLRKAICKIEYDVIPLDARNFEELLGTHMETLNTYELYQAAQYAGLETPRGLELLQAAAWLHPDDATANLNAAVAALQQGNAAAAESLLSKVRMNCPEYENACGMLMILRGQGEDAAAHFRKAAEGGLEAAAANLKQLTN